MIKALDEIVPSSVLIAEKHAREGKFYLMIHDFPDRMRFQYLKMVLESGRNDVDIYKLFLNVYFSSDFGFNEFGTELIRYVIQQRSKESILETQDKIKNLPEKMCLYRGEGSKSTPHEKAFSWTTDINCAYKFACRYGEDSAKIITAEAHRDDIIEYVTTVNENEIFIDPENVRVISELQLKGINFLSQEIDELSDVFLEYKGLLQSIRFTKDLTEHGKEHALRVLLLCLIMGDCYGLSLEDQSKLELAAIFHDSKRVNDYEDRKHGEDGAIYFTETTLISSTIVEFLCKYHSIPDEEGIRAIGDLPYSPERLEEILLLYNIFKDADALDRVRFGFNDLDVNMLRTPLARELPLVARLIFEGLKM